MTWHPASVTFGLKARVWSDVPPFPFPLGSSLVWCQTLHSYLAILKQGWGHWLLSLAGQGKLNLYCVHMVKSAFLVKNQAWCRGPIGACVNENSALRHCVMKRRSPAESQLESSYQGPNEWRWEKTDQQSSQVHISQGDEGRGGRLL